MEKNSLISVIVPIYRVEEYLEQCIQSIIKQTYQNLEIILVDDGSDDSSGAICDAYAKKDKRIKVIHKKNEKQFKARRAGLMIATGEYIGFVDGDDWISENMYEMLLKTATEYDVDVVESGIIDTWEDTCFIRYPYMKQGCYKNKEFETKVELKVLSTERFFTHGVSPYLWNKLFKREAIEKYQLAEGEVHNVLDDVSVVYPCIIHAKSLYVLHESYYYYRGRTNSSKRVESTERVEKFIAYYKDFCKCFEGTSLYKSDDKQLLQYAMYWLLMKAPYIFDENEGNKILNPYGGIKTTDRVVLYGAGAMGIHMESYLRLVLDDKLVCWADKNYRNLQSSLEVSSPETIRECEFDYVILSILREEAVNNAANNLVDMGIDRKKILWIKEEYIKNPSTLLKKIIGWLE